MTQAQQPEALRLAAICESKGMFSVADELNRMHARLLELEQGKCLHQAAEPAAAPFMYAIADGYGNAFFEEQGSVSSEAKDLQPEVDSLNRNLDGEPPYAVVPVYTHPTQQGLDAQMLDFINDKRVALTPEYEGPWKAEVFSDEDAPVITVEGKSVRDAVSAALAAQAKHGEQA